MRRSIIVGAAAILAFAFLGCGRPPQMGADEDVFKTVDALFTAVTARDEKLLGNCEQRLHALKNAEKLPTSAADYLDSVIQKARTGGWESAAEKLYGFIKGQRRDGAQDRPSKKKGDLLPSRE